MPRRARILGTATLYLGFAAAGVGVVLPGALLPALLPFWHVNDRQAANLFLATFVGSSAGALLTGGRLHRLPGAGALLMAAAAAGWLAARAHPMLPALAWGVGVGVLMTATTLLRQAASAVPTADLLRLNLLWAAGAAMCPPLMAPSLRARDPRSALAGAALGFAVLGVLALAAVERPVPRTVSSAAGGAATSPHGARLWLRELAAGLRTTPATILAATALASGIDAAAGSWIAAYAAREQGTLSLVVRAPLALWLGLLGSRLLGFVPDAERHLRRAQRPLLVVVAAAAVLLPAAGNGAGLLAAAFALGFGLGPLYPGLLARALAYKPSGSVFALAGITSSLLPWLTGVVSWRTHSLRMGLVVPAAASLALVACAWSERGPGAERREPRKA